MEAYSSCNKSVSLTHPEVPSSQLLCSVHCPRLSPSLLRGMPVLPRQVGHLVLVPLLHTQPGLPGPSLSSLIWWAQKMYPGRSGLSWAPSSPPLLSALFPTGPGEGISPLLLLQFSAHSSHRCSTRSLLACTALYIHHHLTLHSLNSTDRAGQREGLCSCFFVISY